MSKMTLREAGLLVKLVPFERRPQAIGILLPHIQRPRGIPGEPTMQDWIEWALAPDRKRRRA